MEGQDEGDNQLVDMLHFSSGNGGGQDKFSHAVALN